MRRIKSLYYFAAAHIILLFHYDKKYFPKRIFKGFYRGEEWGWIVKSYTNCKRQGVNMDVPWPVNSRNRVTGWKNITFDPDDLGNFQGFGQYFQGLGKIDIGKGTHIAPNVGIITANHNKDNLDIHDTPKGVTIGRNCWIGMNSTLLPGVVLGDHTIVGAGSVVTKSFQEGNCVIAGNPAKLIKKL